MDQPKAPGPLADITVLELGGIGPLPLLAMLFADLGARIIRIDPVARSATRIGPHLWIFRGQESLTLDLRRGNRYSGATQTERGESTMKRRTLLAGAAALAAAPAFAQAKTKIVFWHAMTGANNDEADQHQPERRVAFVTRRGRGQPP